MANSSRIFASSSRSGSQKATNEGAWSDRSLAVQGPPMALMHRQPRRPVIRIGLQRPVLAVQHALGDGDQRNVLVQDGQDLLREPLHTETGHAADCQIRAGQGLLHGGNVVVLHALAQRAAQVDVVIVCPQPGDDFIVQRAPDQAHFVPVLEQGEGQGRGHLAGADQGDDAHRASFLCRDAGPGGQSALRNSVAEEERMDNHTGCGHIVLVHSSLVLLRPEWCQAQTVLI